MNELTIDAKPENLDAVQDFVAEKLKSANCPIELQMQIAVAVEEIFVNIAYYAYSSKVGSVTIRMTTENSVVIEFEDNGKSYNPLEEKDPDITASAKNREVGGLGIFIIKKTMDTVEYQRIGNKNILTIRKNFPQLYT
ncbi:MAG: ATP-binding protein [Fibromonadaceae bacterium]|jgi:anti-sigma regulatory factor (Ser/Thr protein kinase)|nr:ATP-binding protein [Fibromonadaceae bacterium]